MDGAQLAQASDPGSGGSNLLIQLLIVLLLILVNAFFAASEMALVNVDANKQKEKAEEGNKKAQRIISLMEDPSRFLSIIQVCITLAGFFNSASAAIGISGYLADFFAELGLPSGQSMATILITLLLSFVTIIFGELVPKRLALQNPEGFAYRAVNVLWYASKLLGPLVALLSAITNGVLALMGVSVEEVEEQVTMSDIRSIVQVGQSQGLINLVEGAMINSVISFDDKFAEEIMTPRTEVFAIDCLDDYTEYIDELLSARYSRIPVYEDEIDNVIGILYIKDYIQAAYKVGFANVDIKSIVRPAYFVPERKNINELFNEFQQDNRHMAVLIDEYGGFSGIVTMEDLVEEIVGDIDDEYDHDEPEIEKINEHTYQARGTLSIKELNFNIGSEVDEETEDFDTLGGLLFFLMGRIPDDSEKPFIEYANIRFNIEEIENKRIQWVKIRYNPEEEEDSDN